ncbi:protein DETOXIFICATION 51 [Cajanus cajan]|uniref:Protein DETOXIFICATION n=1 Tax=Cajanus cajan TaxID=3821 RepID=A0A151T2T8_CAJCA|nr:protein DETOXIFICATION 51 [Cajanus cajan]KYP61380.1 Multidrug and toxin extrusion protein 1 [Cajanus cajan]
MCESKREEKEEGWWRRRGRGMWWEAKWVWEVAFPTAVTGLILYLRSMVSMMYLGRLGESSLAAGSLAMAFANISGYSVLSGLSLGMDPLCSQAFGAHRPKLLSLTLHRSILFLLLSSIPISLSWLHFSKLLLLLNQPLHLTKLSQKYLLFLLPDLLTHSFLHPIKLYLRAQNITHPLTLSSLAGTLLHLPFNFLLSKHGVAGIAAASAASTFSILIFLLFYIWITGVHTATWTPPSRDCFTGWKALLRLAAPSCVSVCLEWWWYEVMILLCGLLVDPTATVAAMGVLIQTTSFIYVFPSSLSFAVSTRVGNELGANRATRARISAVLALFLAAVMGFSALLFAVAMRRRWGRMFTSDDGILKLTAAALPILGLCELGNCPQTVACGVLRGTARPNVAANVNLGAFYLIGMPVAVGLAFWLKVGFCGLWLGLLSAQVCCAGLMLYRVGTTDWEYQASRAQMLTALDDSDAQKEPLITV